MVHCSHVRELLAERLEDGIRVPAVVHVSRRLLVLEALRPLGAADRLDVLHCHARPHARRLCAGRGLIDRDFVFRGILTANTLAALRGLSQHLTC